LLVCGGGVEVAEADGGVDRGGDDAPADGERVVVPDVAALDVGDVAVQSAADPPVGLLPDVPFPSHAATGTTTTATSAGTPRMRRNLVLMAHLLYA
jgi:hypothetical protein